MSWISKSKRALSLALVALILISNNIWKTADADVGQAEIKMPFTIEELAEATNESVNVTIKTQSKKVSAAVAAQVKISVKATGTGLKYQWQELKPKGKWKNISGSASKKATLTFKAKAQFNGYQYRCIITDGANEKVISKTVKLTIVSKITKQPKSVTATIGKKLQLSVTATGPSLTYQWQYKKGSKWVNAEGKNSKKAAYSIDATEEMNGRIYRCLIKDANKKTLKSNLVEVRVKDDSTTSDGTFRYEKTKNGKGWIVVKYLKKEKDVVIPPKFNNLPVVELGNGLFDGNKTMVSITLPPSVKIIGENVFRNCTHLLYIKES